jgi:predicted ribosomally synthesized peptide with SipW-like signal peptide
MSLFGGNPDQASTPWEITIVDSKRKSILLTVGAALTVASIGIGAVSMAVFTDTETVDATFTSGTIILDETKINALTLTNTNLMPGDVVTGSVDVENDGVNELRYSLNTTTTDGSSPNGEALSSALIVEVRPIDATTPVTKCNEFDGIPALQASEVLGASNVMFGSISPTVGTGDVVVAAGATHVLCIRISLPIATDDTFQGATAVTTFTFNAEQTENN